MEQSTKQKDPLFRRALTALAYTPARDLLRGRVTGAMSPGQIARDCGLPDELSRLVRSITRRTWLRRSERIEVAHELSDRFAAELRAGDSAKQIKERFGKHRRAIRQIRRQKKRQRHFVGRFIGRTASIGFVAVLFVWLALFVRFHRGEVVIAHDYLAMLNATASNSPPEQQAWPLLRTAVVEWRAAIPEEQWREQRPAMTPDTAGWDETVALLEQSRGALERIRTASTMPYLGYIATHSIHDEDAFSGPSRPTTSGC